MNEREARVGLQCVVDGGHQKVAAMVASEGAEAVWEAMRSRTDGAWAARARAISPERMLGEAEPRGCRFLIPSDAEWPWGASDLEGIGVGGTGGAPLGLWARGALSESLVGSSVGIVGSRAATRYGEDVAGDLSAGLTGLGYAVISGGAYGIDAAAHRGALAAGGRTVAVLACGVDVPYPAGNAALFHALVERGLLLSEVAPGEHPTKARFLVRNRLIAALSKATLIVEAAARSGARNTVTWAHQLGRPVLAVPGPVTSAMSVTPHRLIRDQEATLVTCAAEVHAVLQPLGQVTLLEAEGEQRAFDQLSPQQRQVLEAVPGRGVIATGDLALRAGLDYPRTVLVAGELQEADFLEQGAEGWRLGERRADVIARRRKPVRVVEQDL